MAFLNPSYLWGLLGILIPIAIHLWSKKKVLTIKMGSIQFIDESKSKQHKSIAINELWLLVLRCLIIGAVVLILCEPIIEKPIEKSKITYIFEPSLLESKAITKLLDTISKDKSLLLKHNFPEIDRDHLQPDQSEIPDYWQLVNEIKTFPSDSIVVFTQALISGVKGKRPSMPAHINWVSVYPDQHKESEVVKAIKVGDSITTFTVESDENRYAFAKAKHSVTSLKSSIHNQGDSLSVISNGIKKWIPLETQKPIAVTIVYDNEQQSQVSILKASFKAISKYTEVPINVKTVVATSIREVESINNLVWLSTQETTIKSDKLLVYQPNDDAIHLIASQNDRIYHLTAPVTYKDIYEESFTEMILQWLNIYPELKYINTKLDNRIMPLDQFVGNQKDQVITNTNQVKKASIASYLWVLLLFIIVIERILAYVRKQ